MGSIWTRTLPAAQQLGRLFDCRADDVAENPTQSARGLSLPEPRRVMSSRFWMKRSRRSASLLDGLGEVQAVGVRSVIP